ncbi:MAG: adenylate/guanylate cyclase domain-containing protein [Burkholderiaceae bacterium]
MNEAIKGNRHRLAAILAADAAGYSRLMAHDEEATVASLDEARNAFRVAIQANGGRVIDMAGDSVLAVFETAAGAVSAALEVQKALEDRAAGIPADRRMRFRIGVHLGDVIEKPDGSVYGDGVNIAARLEGLALAGGITVSDAVQGAVRHRIAASFEDLGDQLVKNIADPVRAFRVHASVPGNDEPQTMRAIGGPRWSRVMRWRWWVAGGVLGLLLAGVLGVTLTRGLRADLAGIAPTTMSVTVGAITAPSNDAAAMQAAEALGHELASVLGRINGNVRVMSPNRGQNGVVDVGARELARRSGIRYVVEGDVRVADTKRIVNLRLIESQRGTQPWSGSFELPESGSSFETSVATRNMVGQLASSIENAEISRVLLKPVGQLDAMELVVRAWAALDKGQSLANAQEARKLLDEALRLDPTLVPALIAIGWEVDLLNDVDPHTDHDRYVRETDEFSARAVTLDPNSSRAWEGRAVALMLLGRWSASLEASDRQIKLDPYGQRPFLIRAWLMSMMGRPAQALPYTDKAAALNPSNPGREMRFACEAHLLLGQAEKAIEACERASGVDTDFIHHSFLAAAYANAGDTAHARVALAAMLKMIPGYTIAQLRAKRYSDHPEYQKLAEKYWYEGLRKAGLPEK